MMMANESKSALDYVLLVVIAVIIVLLMVSFFLILPKSSGLAYSLALLALIVWPAVAPLAARRLIKEKVYWGLFHAWGIYVLLLAYVIFMGISYAISVGAHNYLKGKHRKISRKPRQQASATSPTL